MRRLRLLPIIVVLFLSILAPLYSQGAPGDGGPPTEAILRSPSGVAVDSSGNVFIAERQANRIRKVDAATGLISTYAGTGQRAYSGDGGPAAEAAISIPELIALDSVGNLYIADRGNARVRRVEARTGIITTVAGNGTPGYSGDGGPATEAEVSYPFGVHLDPSGNLYIADTENHVIRRVDAGSGDIRTVAGTAGQAGFEGDGGPAVDAKLNRPHNMITDLDGGLIIGDSENQRIRRVDLSTGLITTPYGSGRQGVSPDGIDARQAAFSYFGALAWDSEGHLLLTGWVDNRLRRIDRRTGVISTIAGTGEGGLSGDGGPASQAKLNGPYGLAVDDRGNIYIAEAKNFRVRRIDAETGVISTLAGR